ncbi:MAG: alpha/beta hydrolase [Alphaproteobacteria bacterium]|nr:alpha/beta hydrolase [Alphaproteobacteria bacterium]
MKAKGRRLGEFICADARTAVLLHGSTGSGAMWRDLAKSLRGCFEVLAPDLVGYGKAAPWPGGTGFGLEREAEAIAPLLPDGDARFHLVGYSYGGAVALSMALARPDRVASLTLIEPVAFSLLRGPGSGDALAEIEAASSAFNATLRLGDVERAVGQFVDYWSGAGAWKALPEALRDEARRVAAKITLDYEATLSDPTRIEDCARLHVPTLVMVGGKGPEPTRRIATLVAGALPNSRYEVVAEADHKLPFTHAALLKQTVRRFLGCC